MTLKKKLKVLAIPGAVRLVPFNGQPATLPASEIEILKNRLLGARGLEPHPYLWTERLVRVRSGALVGLEGIVLRRKDRCRVVFSINLLKRSAAVEVGEADLEAA